MAPNTPSSPDESPDDIMAWDECVAAVERFDPAVDYVRVLRSVVAHMRARAERGASDSVNR